MDLAKQWWAVVVAILSGVGGAVPFHHQPEGFPRSLFEGIVREKIPESLYDIQGAGGAWQSYNLEPLFRAVEELIDKLLQDGVEQISWAEVHE
jgi:hypothetical protein